MSAITTHVLDTARGCPAVGVRVTLEQSIAGEWRLLGDAETDADGRLLTLMPKGVELVPGSYRLVFDTGRYFDELEAPTFYPYVTIVFDAAAGETHYHVPLLLNPFGYTTYRGS